MKVSVSLPDEDVAYLDAYAEAQGLQSRSAALPRAVRLLRASELGAAYEDAWAEWSTSEDADLWEHGLTDPDDAGTGPGPWDADPPAPTTDGPGGP
ncbi:MAG: ribbon-helix-helix domain-containing protein [Acidimicrobiales bacterium]